jgi:hypothetical protein
MTIVFPYKYKKFILFQNALEKNMIDGGQTLPLLNKRHIVIIWKDDFTKKSIRTSFSFNFWIDKLH